MKSGAGQYEFVAGMMPKRPMYGAPTHSRWLLSVMFEILRWT